MVNHDQLLQRAERLRNTFRDCLDDPSNSQARSLGSSIERLISDLHAKKDGDAIENDLKVIISGFDRLDQSVMDYSHSDSLKGDCENMFREAGNL